MSLRKREEVQAMPRQRHLTEMALGQIVYQVTVEVQVEHADRWQNYMLSQHIADVMKTGCFSFAEFFREVERGDFVTFQTRYSADSILDYERYRRDFAPAMQEHHNTRFGEVTKAERLLLEPLQRFEERQ